MTKIMEQVSAAPQLVATKMGVAKDYKKTIGMVAFIALALVGLGLASYLTGFPKEIPGKLYVLIGSGGAAFLTGLGTFAVLYDAANKRQAAIQNTPYCPTVFKKLSDFGFAELDGSGHSFVSSELGLNDDSRNQKPGEG